MISGCWICTGSRSLHRPQLQLPRLSSTLIASDSGQKVPAALMLRKGHADSPSGIGEISVPPDPDLLPFQRQRLSQDVRTCAADDHGLQPPRIILRAHSAATFAGYRKVSPPLFRWPLRFLCSFQQYLVVATPSISMAHPTPREHNGGTHVLCTWEASSNGAFCNGSHSPLSSAA